MLAETDCSTVRSTVRSIIINNLTLLVVTPSGDNKTVANDSQDWANGSLEIPSGLYSCIGWSALLNHLTDGVCYNSRFQIGLSTQRVWSVIRNDAIMTWLFQTVWTYAIVSGDGTNSEWGIKGLINLRLIYFGGARLLCRKPFQINMARVLYNKAKNVGPHPCWLSNPPHR